jgi:hypothetical protein
MLTFDVEILSFFVWQLIWQLFAKLGFFKFSGHPGCVSHFQNVDTPGSMSFHRKTFFWQTFGLHSSMQPFHTMTG